MYVWIQSIAPRNESLLSYLIASCMAYIYKQENQAGVAIPSGISHCLLSSSLQEVYMV